MSDTVDTNDYVVMAEDPVGRPTIRRHIPIDIVAAYIAQFLGEFGDASVVADALAAHIADTSAVHAASAVSFDGSDDNVQDAIDTLDSSKANLIHGHAADTISFSWPEASATTVAEALTTIIGWSAADILTLPIGGMTALNVQQAIEELLALSSSAFTLVEGTDISIVNNGDGTLTISYTGVGGGGGGGSSPYDGAIIVASSQAPADVRANAHYTCDGTADDVQINAAIVDANATTGNGGQTGGEQGGTVLLTGGRFNIAAPIKMRTGVTLRGQGRLTELRAVGLGTSAIIEQNAATDHLFVIRDLWCNGNGSSGGTGSAIHLASTQGASRSAYPDVNPDPDIWIDGLLITNCGNGSTRNGIWMDTDQRGTMISNCQIRSCSLHGIFMDSSPDSHLTNIHIGTINGDGFRISGGNNKLVNCKAYYCDTNGFNVTSGRGSLTGCEAQDNVVGFRIAASPVSMAGCNADTSSTDGLIIAGNYASIAGFNVFHRSSGRYATCQRGVTFSGTPTNSTVVGNVNPTDITAPVSGTFSGANNHVHIPYGSGQASVG